MRYFVSLAMVIAFLACSQRNSSQTSSLAPVPVSQVPVPRSMTGPFEPVRDILRRTCAPCHNPGGKMYARLPFDNPDVIRANQEGILRRLSGENKATLEKWLTTQND